MQAVNQARVQELIAQLAKQQQGQIQCLQELFGLASGDNAKKLEVIEKVKRKRTYLAHHLVCRSIIPHAWLSGTA